MSMKQAMQEAFIAENAAGDCLKVVDRIHKMKSLETLILALMFIQDGAKYCVGFDEGFAQHCTLEKEDEPEIVGAPDAIYYEFTSEREKWLEKITPSDGYYFYKAGPNIADLIQELRGELADLRGDSTDDDDN
jgi:hypothetical protein